MDAEMGTFVHAAEGEMVCESTNIKIPFFNAPMYLENKVRKGFGSIGPTLTPHRQPSAKSTRS